MDFGPITYYDGQQPMARASDGYTPDATVADIDGSVVVCGNADTTTEKNIPRRVLPGHQAGGELQRHLRASSGAPNASWLGGPDLRSSRRSRR